jgi:quercetin dioxygenase-like cupin family protein
MIIQRWEAPLMPTETQIFSLLQKEGIEVSLNQWGPRTEIKDHRHFLSEILFVSEGSLILNVNGNQVLLRQGDRAEIPSNTKHSYLVQDSESCRVIIGYRL